ncbi:MAG: hypothetical protein GWN11_09295 [Candidatus Dadabacteria bacterium]|nr:hypothetical protein [Candidatus Dadabacteria bacterium]
MLRKEPMEMMLAAKKAGDIAVDNNTVLIVAAYTIADIILWILSVVDAKRNAEIIEKQIENKNDE